jgi:hypothetical protein
VVSFALSNIILEKKTYNEANMALKNNCIMLNLFYNRNATNAASINHENIKNFDVAIKKLLLKTLIDLD